MGLLDDFKDSSLVNTYDFKEYWVLALLLSLVFGVGIIIGGGFVWEGFVAVLFVFFAMCTLQLSFVKPESETDKLIRRNGWK